MAQRKQWRDLSPQQRAGILILGALQLLLFGAAQIDIHRRPAEDIRGSKGLWRALAFVNFFGPLAYFALGRRD